MTCEEFRELFSDYITAEIDPALMVSVDNHLATCSETPECMADLKALWGELDVLPVVSPPADLVSRVSAALNDEEDSKRKTSTGGQWARRFSLSAVGYAAAAALAVVAGMGGLHVTRASLDPLGSVLRLMHPTPSHVVELSECRAEWSPNTQGSGTLTVHAKAQPEADGSTAHIHCVINVPSNLALSPNNNEADVSSDSDATMVIPLQSAPAASSISVTISALANTGNSVSKTEPVTLMEPKSAP